MADQEKPFDLKTPIEQLLDKIADDLVSSTKHMLERFTQQDILKKENVLLYHFIVEFQKIIIPLKPERKDPKKISSLDEILDGIIPLPVQSMHPYVVQKLLDLANEKNGNPFNFEFDNKQRAISISLKPPEQPKT